MAESGRYEVRKLGQAAWASADTVREARGLYHQAVRRLGGANPPVVIVDTMTGQPVEPDRWADIDKLEDRLALLPNGVYTVTYYKHWRRTADDDPAVSRDYVVRAARRLPEHEGMVAVCRSQDHVEPLIVGDVPTSDA